MRPTMPVLYWRLTPTPVNAFLGSVAGMTGNLIQRALRGRPRSLELYHERSFPVQMAPRGVDPREFSRNQWRVLSLSTPSSRGAIWGTTTWHTRRGLISVGDWGEPGKPEPPTNGPSALPSRSRSGDFLSDGWPICLIKLLNLCPKHLDRDSVSKTGSPLADKADRGGHHIL